MNKCLPILQNGKTNPKYKETKKNTENMNELLLIVKGR